MVRKISPGETVRMLVDRSDPICSGYVAYRGAVPTETVAADEGVLVIPVDDADTWYVEGVEWALIKVLRLHRNEGVWPDRAAFYG